MAEAEYSKLDIAREHLDAAMQHYIEGRNYFCAIHLAGAAEELFGAHLPEKERILNISWKAQIDLHGILGRQQLSPKESRRLLLRAKNQIKHDKFGERTIVIDPISEARRWIEDALINFYTLRECPEHRSLLPISAAMRRFGDVTVDIARHNPYI